MEFSVIKKLKKLNINFYLSITKNDKSYIIDKSFGEEAKTIKNQVENFTNTFESNFGEQENRNFKRNLASLYIKKNTDLTHPDATGEYSVLKNTIFIKKNVGLTLYHELFHTAANINENSGFERQENNLVYYRGINEGYTDLMTSKYFDDGKSRPGYFAETTICAMLDEIVGKDIMEKLYLNSNVEGLLNELYKYFGDDKALELLEILDSIYDEFDCENYNAEKVDKLLKQAYIYLCEAYITKMRLEYKNNRLSITTAKLMALNFMDNWDAIISFDGHEYNLTTDSIKEKIIKNNIHTI